MTTPRQNQKVVLEGRGPLTLRPNDHIATGGEGSVFRAGNTVVKIYTDKKHVRVHDIAGKIRALSKLKHPFIVSPSGLVLNSKGNEIGFYMPFAKGEPLVRVFTNDFRQRANFDDANASTLAARMQEVFHYAHDNRALLVDANEFNWLATLGKKKGPEPRVIDVDSWAIGKWPATAIMPSMRDWHSSAFNEGSDWFVWGVVSFQLYTGIHPYKGRLDGFSMGDLEGRMKANASVFDSGVRLNRAVRDFSRIPGPLLDWYVAAFQEGERSIPPSPLESGTALAKAARVLRTVTTASGSLVYEKILEVPGDEVVRVFPCGVALLKSGKLIEFASKRTIGIADSASSEIVAVHGGWLKADYDGSKFVFAYISSRDLSEVSLQSPLRASRVLRYEDRLFIVGEQGLSEISLKILGKPILAVGQTWGALEHATRWFDGVGVQDTMGATYLVAPFGESACAHMRVRELDGFTPTSAKAGDRFVTIVAADQNGAYHKFELTFDRDYTTYDIWQGGTDSPDLNIAMLPKGVCAAVVNDGELVVFVPTTKTLNKVSDKDIATDMLLYNWKNKVLYIKGGALWSIRMR